MKVSAPAMRVFRVIDSCTTIEQWRVAKAYAHRWYKTMPWFSSEVANLEMIGMVLRDKYFLLNFNQQRGNDHDSIS